MKPGVVHRQHVEQRVQSCSPLKLEMDSALCLDGYVLNVTGISSRATHRCPKPNHWSFWDETLVWLCDPNVFWAVPAHMHWLFVSQDFLIGFYQTHRPWFIFMLRYIKRRPGSSTAVQIKCQTEKITSHANGWIKYPGINYSGTRKHTKSMKVCMILTE